MTSCVFDNPILHRRQYWHNGNVNPNHQFPPQVRIGAQFKPGFVYGDASALSDQAKKAHRQWRKLDGR